MGEGVECAEWCVSVEQQCEGRLKVHTSHVRRIVRVWVYSNNRAGQYMYETASHIDEQKYALKYWTKGTPDNLTKESRKNILRKRTNITVCLMNYLADMTPHLPPF